MLCKLLVNLLMEGDWDCGSAYVVDRLVAQLECRGFSVRFSFFRHITRLFMS
jgi:hypothetical protein